MATEISFLSDIKKGTDANNDLLSDIAEFIEEIKDKVIDYIDNFGGSVNVSSVSSTTAQNISGSSGNGDLDSIVGAINSIVANAARFRGSRDIGDMIAGIGKGVKEFAHVLKDGATLKVNRGSLDAIIESINYLAENIQTYNDIDLKRKTVFLFSSIGNAIGTFTKDLWNSAIKLKTGKQAIRWIVEGINYMMEKLSTSNSLFTSVDSGMGKKTAFEVIMNSLGDSIYKFSQHLWSTAIKLRTGKIAITWIVEAIDKIATSLTRSERGLTNIGLLSNVGVSVFKFASLVALAAPFMVLAIPSLLLLAGALAIFTFAMKFFDDGLMESAKILGKVGISILLFSGSLVLGALMMSVLATGPGMMGLAILFGSMAVLGLVFYLFGKAFSEMGKGALGLALISLAIPLFAFSLAISAAMISDVGILNVLGLLGAVAGAALVFGLAGMFAIEIALGALAIAMVGGSLWVLAWGLEAMTKMMDNTNIWQLLGQAGIIVGLGLIYAAAGVALPFIAAGALAIGVIALSLWGLSKGISAIMDININEDKIDSFAGAIPKFIEAFTSISFSQMLTIPLRLPAILSLALGIGALAEGVKAWSKIDITDSEIENMSTIMTKVLTIIPSIFGKIGAADAAGESWSFTKGLFGVDFGSGNVEKGIELAQKYANTLGPMADGIMKWRKMTFTKEEVDDMTNKIGIITGIIPSVFGKIGAADSAGQPWSFTKAVFGADFGTGDVEKGVELALKYANILGPLADGVMKWKNGIYYKDIAEIGGKMQYLVSMVPSIFASLGKESKDTEGVISDSDIDVGIDIVKKVTPVLDSVSKFILSFKDTKDIRQTGFDVAMAMRFIFGAVSIIADSFKEKGEDMTSMVDMFDSLTKNFGKFGDNVGKSVKFLKEFTSYVAPMDKLAASFERITFSIERQVKSINSIVSANFTSYSGMIGSLTELSKSNLATVESNMSYTLGSGFNSSDNNYTSSFPYMVGNTARPVAPSVIPAKTAANQNTASKLSSEKEILGQILGAIKENTAIPPQIDGQALGLQIAQAIVSYFKSNDFKIH